MNYIETISEETNIIISLIGEQKASYMYNNILTLTFDKCIRMNKSSIYNKYKVLYNYYNKYCMEHSDNFKDCILSMIDNLKYMLQVKERENYWNLMIGDED